MQPTHTDVGLGSSSGSSSSREHITTAQNRCNLPQCCKKTPVCSAHVHPVSHCSFKASVAGASQTQCLIHPDRYPGYHQQLHYHFPQSSSSALVCFSAGELAECCTVRCWLAAGLASQVPHPEGQQNRKIGSHTLAVTSSCTTAVLDTSFVQMSHTAQHSAICNARSHQAESRSDPFQQQLLKHSVCMPQSACCIIGPTS